MTPLTPRKKKSIYWLERDASKVITKKIKSELILNRKLYGLGDFIFSMLPRNFAPQDKTQLVALIMLARGLEYTRAISHLLKYGYISQSAALTADSMEIYLQMKKIKRDGIRAAGKWLQHAGNQTCWKITGPDGLFKELEDEKLEGHYKLLCTLKHTQSKTKHFNYLTDENRSSIVTAPIVDIPKIQFILAYCDGVIERLIRIVAEIFQNISDKHVYNQWEIKLNLLSGVATQLFKQRTKC